MVYAHGTQGDQTVTWTTDNPKVATVTQKGLVTAVSEGTAEIVALSKEGSKNGTPVMETYQLTVTKQGASSADDVLSLSATTVTTSGGQYVEYGAEGPGGHHPQRRHRCHRRLTPSPTAGPTAPRRSWAPRTPS